jgi:hypothetical protein
MWISFQWIFIEPQRGIKSCHLQEMEGNGGCQVKQN